MVKALIENLSLCVSQYKINPLLVVTRASLVGNTSDQNTIKTKISNRFKIQEAHIFMIDNYTIEKDKSMRVDKMILEIVVRALQLSQTFQSQYRSKLEKDLDLAPPPPISNDTMIKCPSCNEDNYADDDDCTYCSAPLRGGAVLKCWNCSNDISGEKCENCKAWQTLPATCCGRPVTGPKTPLFCGKCKSPFPKK